MFYYTDTFNYLYYWSKIHTPKNYNCHTNEKKKAEWVIFSSSSIKRFCLISSSQQEVSFAFSESIVSVLYLSLVGPCPLHGSLLASTKPCRLPSVFHVHTPKSTTIHPVQGPHPSHPNTILWKCSIILSFPFSLSHSVNLVMSHMGRLWLNAELLYYCYQRGRGVIVTIFK